MKPLGRVADDPVQLVSDLIVEETNQWDEGRVRSIFLLQNAKAILSMPRPRRQHSVVIFGLGLGIGMACFRSGQPTGNCRSNRILILC